MNKTAQDLEGFEEICVDALKGGEKQEPCTAIKA